MTSYDQSLMKYISSLSSKKFHFIVDVDSFDCCLAPQAIFSQMHCQYIF